METGKAAGCKDGIQSADMMMSVLVYMSVSLCVCIYLSVYLYIMSSSFAMALFR